LTKIGGKKSGKVTLASKKGGRLKTMVCEEYETVEKDTGYKSRGHVGLTGNRECSK